MFELPHIFILMSGRWETTGRIYGPHSLSVPLLDVRQVKQEVTPLFILQGRGSPNDVAQVSGFPFLC